MKLSTPLPQVRLAVVALALAACASAGFGRDPRSWVGRSYKEVAPLAGTFDGKARVGDTALVYFCGCSDERHGAAVAPAAAEPPGAAVSPGDGESAGADPNTVRRAANTCDDIRYVLYVGANGKVQAVRDWRAGKTYR